MLWLWRRVSSGAWHELAVLVKVPTEMQIKALRWCSSRSRAVAVLACHRCLFISASSRNGPHWSKKRSLPIQGFISQRSSFTAHAFHFHSFSLWQIKLQQHVLMSSLIVQTFWCPVQREDCFLHHLSGSALSDHHHPTELYSFTAVPDPGWWSHTEASVAIGFTWASASVSVTWG